MENENNLLWRAKLDARLHDPIEKALVLMRTPGQGHEQGTSRTLRAQFGLDKPDSAIAQAVKQADWWASAMDRAAFPHRNTDGRYPKWQQVRFHDQPVLIHPLTGEAFDLKKIDIEPEAAQQLATKHSQGLVHEGRAKQTSLAFWRFGPELASKELRNLWRLLPADTRVPDHTIHDHLDLTSALAGAFAADPEGGPALLAVSLGPVQDFIAQARSTSDLWAGSHLLSCIAWQAMQVICERLGPEAILFPRLRGVPLVDLWLQVNQGLKPELFARLDWRTQKTDANPLFAAALPNRFTALVPARQARELAGEITRSVRDWVTERARDAFRELLQIADEQDDASLHGYQQIEQQLQGFPEVHWAAVPWSLIETDGDGKVDASSARLAEAMQPYFQSNPPGFLGTQAWQLISQGLELEQGTMRWKPNPGALYPALSELLERTLAAIKSAREFAALDQSGWRDSTAGQVEWITTDVNQLKTPSGQRKETLWTRVANKRPALVKVGEHLGATDALKRMWPTLFVNEIGQAIELDLDRFVVSTHAMALAGSLAGSLDRPLPAALRSVLEQSRSPRVALPRGLATELNKHRHKELLFRLTGWVEAQRDSDDDSARGRAERLLKEYFGHTPESYYAMLLMDGDQMGAWMSADRDKTLQNGASFHPQIRATLETSFADDPNFARYAQEKRAANPARHMLISDALNNFAIRLAPEIVERQHHGRILYAGGDDLMAMLTVRDLLPAMAQLRAAYSGVRPDEAGARDAAGDPTEQAFHLEFKGASANGFIEHGGELLRMMGEQASASCGAVIAHYKAPLAAVLRELRKAEQRAKQEGGRNAFSISVVKRSGGALRLTAKFGKPLQLLIRLRDFLAEDGVSRRAVYNSAVWLRDLAPPADESTRQMLGDMLYWQLARQTQKKTLADYNDLPGLCTALVEQAMQALPDEPGKVPGWIENFLSVAEFLARETRMPISAGQSSRREQQA